MPFAINKPHKFKSETYLYNHCKDIFHSLLPQALQSRIDFITLHLLSGEQEAKNKFNGRSGYLPKNRSDECPEVNGRIPLGEMSAIANQLLDSKATLTDIIHRELNYIDPNNREKPVNTCIMKIVPMDPIERENLIGKPDPDRPEKDLIDFGKVNSGAPLKRYIIKYSPHLLGYLLNDNLYNQFKYFFNRSNATSSNYSLIQLNRNLALAGFYRNITASSADYDLICPYSKKPSSASNHDSFLTSIDEFTRALQRGFFLSSLSLKPEERTAITMTIIGRRINASNKNNSISIICFVGGDLALEVQLLLAEELEEKFRSVALEVFIDLIQNEGNIQNKRPRSRFFSEC